MWNLYDGLAHQIFEPTDIDGHRPNAPWANSVARRTRALGTTPILVSFLLLKDESVDVAINKQ